MYNTDYKNRFLTLRIFPFLSSEIKEIRERIFFNFWSHFNFYKRMSLLDFANLADYEEKKVPFHSKYDNSWNVFEKDQEKYLKRQYDQERYAYIFTICDQEDFIDIPLADDETDFELFIDEDVYLNYTDIFLEEKDFLYKDDLNQNENICFSDDFSSFFNLTALFENELSFENYAFGNDNFFDDLDVEILLKNDKLLSDLIIQQEISSDNEEIINKRYVTIFENSNYFIRNTETLINIENFFSEDIIAVLNENSLENNINSNFHLFYTYYKTSKNFLNFYKYDNLEENLSDNDYLKENFCDFLFLKCFIVKNLNNYVDDSLEFLTILKEKNKKNQFFFNIIKFLNLIEFKENYHKNYILAVEKLENSENKEQVIGEHLEKEKEIKMEEEKKKNELSSEEQRQKDKEYQGRINSKFRRVKNRSYITEFDPINKTSYDIYRARYDNEPGNVKEMKYYKNILWTPNFFDKDDWEWVEDSLTHEKPSFWKTTRRLYDDYEYNFPEKELDNELPVREFHLLNEKKKLYTDEELAEQEAAIKEAEEEKKIVEEKKKKAKDYYTYFGSFIDLFEINYKMIIEYVDTLHYY